MIVTLQDFLGTAGAWALMPIFLVVMLESSAFLGLLFPGEAVALIAGALSATQVFSPWAAFAAVASGAIVGDVAGYGLGRLWGQSLLARWSFARRQYELHRQRLELYFDRFGIATVLIGRFVAVGRAFVPFTAGLSGMPARRFIPMGIVAGVLWGGVVVALGYVLGSNWRLVERWMRSLGAGVLVLGLLTIVMIASWRWLAARQNKLTSAWHRYSQRYGVEFAPLTEFIRARLSPTGYIGLHFTVGLIAVIAMGWMFGAVVQDIFAQDPMVYVDRRVAVFISEHRTPALDAVGLATTFLSNSWWLLFMTAVVAIATSRAGDWAISTIAAIVLGGSYGLALVLQSLFSAYSPHVPESALVHGFTGFPSVSIAAASASYGIACYSFAVHASGWRLQTFSVMVALYIVLVNGLGALYAGQLLSAIIGGFAVGGCWLAICLTGYFAYVSLSREVT